MVSALCLLFAMESHAAMVTISAAVRSVFYGISDGTSRRTSHAMKMNDGTAVTPLIYHAITRYVGHYSGSCSNIIRELSKYS